MNVQQLLAALKQQKQLIPLLLLMVYCLDAIIKGIRGNVEMAGVTYGFVLTGKHYVAFGAVGLNVLTYFFLRPIYKYTLGLTVAVGLFNLITFSALETTFSFAINRLKVSFQPSAFLAGLLAYIINFKRVNSIIFDNLTTVKTTEELEKREQARFEEGVRKFKRKYESYSNQTLAEIVTANRYVPEALEAARQLLNERESNI